MTGVNGSRPPIRTESRWRSSSSRSGTSGDVGELGAQLEHSLGVHLADPALGDTENAADVGQREPLEVVEADDDLLPLRQLLDGTGEELAGPPPRGQRPRGG